MKNNNEISIIGVLITIFAIIIFTVLTYKIVGLFALIIGPIVALFACRPPENSDRWLWQKKTST